MVDVKARDPHKDVQLRLERALNARVLVKPRVDLPGRLIVVVDVPVLPDDIAQTLRKTLPNYLHADAYTYDALRLAARDPDSPLELLVAAAHVFPRSVEANPVLEWIALEDAGLAERLQALL
jgi:hypothetical protein